MPLLSKLIMQLCIYSANPTCVEQIHICVRDVFQINFWDELTPEQEIKLPYQIEYCEGEMVREQFIKAIKGDG